MVTPLEAYNTESFTFFASLRRRAQRVGIFQYWAGLVQVSKKNGGFRSGRSFEIFDRVFLGTLFTLGYFRVYWVFQVIPNISGYLIPDELNQVRYQKKIG